MEALEVIRVSPYHPTRGLHNTPHDTIQQILSFLLWVTPSGASEADTPNGVRKLKGCQWCTVCLTPQFGATIYNTLFLQCMQVCCGMFP